MKNLIRPRALRREITTNYMEATRPQKAASITLRRHLRHIKDLLVHQEMHVMTLELQYPYSSQFPGDHPELARARAVLQGMQTIAEKLFPKA